MNTKLAARPLTDLSKPWGVIRFIHPHDGREHEFYTAVNRLTGDRLTAFDNEPPNVNASLAWTRTMFRNIRERSPVIIGFVGDIIT